MVGANLCQQMVVPWLPGLLHVIACGFLDQISVRWALLMLNCSVHDVTEPEPMDICPSTLSVECEISTSDVTILEGHTSEVLLISFLSSQTHFISIHP